MTPHRILGLNATATAACAIGMLLTRGSLYTLFGLETSLLLDVLAIGLLGYAAALAAAARCQRISREVLVVFTLADATWVIGSTVVLLACWDQFAPLARFLVFAVALVVETFAMLQFRAAEAASRLVAA